jgi:hypothetical protein
MVWSLLSFLSLCSIIPPALAQVNFRHHKLREENIDNPVPGQFIIELHPQYDPRGRAKEIRKALRKAGVDLKKKAQVRYYYDNVMKGFALSNIPDDKLAIVLNNPTVKQVWNVSICGLIARCCCMTVLGRMRVSRYVTARGLLVRYRGASSGSCVCCLVVKFDLSRILTYSYSACMFYSLALHSLAQSFSICTHALTGWYALHQRDAD